MQTNTSTCTGSEFGSKSSNIPLEGSQKLKIATPPRARSEKKSDSYGGRGCDFRLFAHLPRNTRGAFCDLERFGRTHAERGDRGL